MIIQFPAGFLWGAAASSYQIEGATREGGRLESIWDRFAYTPGKVKNGDNGDIACDHYHRYPEDIGLMQALGVSSYRFSIAWPRILPTGKGTVNQAGLDFYDRLVDALLAAKIEPFATLYHWDLPQALEDEGGWRNRRISDYFAIYADVVSRRLGDRVKHWMTINEPWCIAYLGHAMGEHAPGVRDMSYKIASQVSHHVNLAHGKAVPFLRQNSLGSQVGIVLNMWPCHPASDNQPDRDAAHRVDVETNRWFADPIFKGEYPAERIAALGAGAPEIQPGDMAIISAPLDFVGINYYNRSVHRSAPEADNVTKAEQVRIDSSEHTAMDWEVYPDGMREILVRVHRDYQPKAMYITENGCAYHDQVSVDGTVDDPKRIAYLEGHLRAVHRAIDEGAPIKGYFYWSLLDNFEWAHGYRYRFGLIYVDYATQKRIPKRSFEFFCQAILRNGLEG